MLEPVPVGRRHVAAYAESAGDDAVEGLRELAAPLRGVRVLHVNATPYGGGVAEILRAEVPLLRDLGLCADWWVIDGNQAFFATTKAIHNGLQGAERPLSERERTAYLDSEVLSVTQDLNAYDVIVVHDPQPLPLLQRQGKGSARWIWRCHIDTSNPYPDTWMFLKPYLDEYDAAVFTLGTFVPPDMPKMPVVLIAPAIDPESPKNIDLDERTARRVLQWMGVAVDRPLVTQISRYDHWKDPLGVITAFRRARQEVPGLQLVLAGSMALDDPEGAAVYAEVQAEAAGDDDVHLFTSGTGMGDLEANAFQRLSSVVVQKSLREGFGLVVSEALWKRTPVVAGRAGGIPLQLCDGAGGFLVDSVESCVERLVWLLQHPGEAQALAERGQALVRERYLLTRLLADELRLYAGLLGIALPASCAGESAIFADGVRDPICGRRVEASAATALANGTAPFQFCSETCRDLYALSRRANAPERGPSPRSLFSGGAHCEVPAERSAAD